MKFLVLTLAFFALAPMVLAAPVSDEEFVGPFPSWANVKTVYGAVGDGIADDTAALQRGLDGLQHNDPPRASVLFFPAGTYRITRGLTMTSHCYAALIGEDPATTCIKWDGADEGVMLLGNGIRWVKFSRLTWDGSGKKVTGVFHAWDGKTPGAGTANEHSDEVFKDLAFGIRAGKPHFMDAETPILRCKFLRCSEAGVRIQSFNALDWFIWDSEFEDCRVGVSNDPGAGHFHVYRSVFRNSTEADIVMRNCSYFGIRHNFSVGSKRFLDARPVGGWSMPLMIQRNTIIDPRETTAIAIANLGTALLVDNVVRSRADVPAGPAVKLEGPFDGDLVAVGNTFTVPDPIKVKGRATLLDNTTMKRSAINPEIPALPPTPKDMQRMIIEVPAGADAAAIQAAIDRAAKLAGQRPVVHLPAGTYKIAATLVIPAGADVQLLGDGYRSTLRWNGADGGTLLYLPGPCRALCRDLNINGNRKAAGVRVDNCDQPGARVFSEQAGVNDSQVGLLVDGLNRTDVSLHDFYHSGNTQIAVKVAGGDKPAGARTVIFGGASSGNEYSYEVTKGGRLMAQDIWYEGAPLHFMKLNDSGAFTLSCGMMACGRPGPNTDPTDPNFCGVVIDNFKGDVSFLTNNYSTRLAVLGAGKETNVLALGVEADMENFVSNTSPAARVVVRNCRRYAKGEPPTAAIPDSGGPDDAFLLKMLQQVRSDLPRPLFSVPRGSTDLRLYRVNIEGCTTALQLKGK